MAGRVNYVLRPAKAIERKMLAETFRRLTPFARLDRYRYIGLGSTYFGDFWLFHRMLGVRSMISIEHDQMWRDRFRYNRPFRCVSMRFGHSNAVLPTFGWDRKPTIAWLDYDDPLTAQALADTRTICTRTKSGSVFAITVNAHLRETDQNRLALLRDRVTQEKVPLDITEAHLTPATWADVLRRIFDNEVHEALAARNGLLAPERRIQYRQLWNFRYADGARMATFGGILYEQRRQSVLSQCRFDELSFVRHDQSSYRIEVPQLTYREIRYLDPHLPLSDRPRRLDLPEVDVERYARVYRYFPMFAETEL